MKFFMPDWSDTVDPAFDFRADIYSRDRTTATDVFAHEIFQTTVYDGILVSRAVVEKSPANFKELTERRARSFYRLRPGMRVFGDCGAFSYVNEKEPWYETDDVLDYYEAIGVDYGASVDHLVVETLKVVTSPLTTNGDQSNEIIKRVSMSAFERRRRVEVTLDNAAEFLRKHAKRKLGFTPVGVAQGWSPKTYADSVKALLKMGYRYVALGGLARSPLLSVLQVLWEVNAALEDSVKVQRRAIRIHLFGVAKLSLVHKFRKYRIESIDSASYLRKAWLRSGENYLGPDRRWYTAIRVPQSENYRLREHVKKMHASYSRVKELEQSCLDKLQRYGEAGLSPSALERLLDEIVEYDKYLIRSGNDGMTMREATVSRLKYRKTLLARPWEKCPCEICTQLGIHVVIFRGTNRNKRRGYHNTWTFYRLLRAALK